MIYVTIVGIGIVTAGLIWLVWEGAKSADSASKQAREENRQ